MHLTPHIALSVVALSGLAFAAPVSQNGTALTRRDTIECRCPYPPECYYGDQLTLEDYTAYLKKYYQATDHYILYSGSSVAQVKNFQGAENPGYFFYDDFFDSTVSKNYLTQWPAMTDSATGNPCYREDDAEASSRSISLTVSGEVLVFGAVEYQTKGQNSFFATEEVQNLRDKINDMNLNKITHMIMDATKPSDVLATEDANMKITYAEGQEDGTPNASGSFGDCSTTEAAPDCDIPSGNADIHE